MTGLVGKATLLCVCGLVLAGTALAAVPDPAHSTMVASVRVVGSNGSGADASGTFTVTIRDFSNAPIANVDVKYDFANCTDGRLCKVGGTGTLDCTGTNKEWHATTNGAGQASFNIQGGVKDPAPTCVGATCSPPGPGQGCIQVFANGVPMGSATATYINKRWQDGTGVNSADLSVQIQEGLSAALGAPYRGRNDLQFNGAVNSGDLSAQIAAGIASGLGTGSNIGCAAVNQCPN